MQVGVGYSYGSKLVSVLLLPDLVHMSTGGSTAQVGEFYASAIKKSGKLLCWRPSICGEMRSAVVMVGIEFDVLFGPAYKGIPLAAATSIAMYNMFGEDVPYAYNRKEVKVLHHSLCQL